MIKAKRLLALGVAAESRLASLPDVPIFKQQGLPFVAGTWFGVFVSARTPPEVVARLEQALRRALEHPDLRDVIARDGATPDYADPQRFKAFVDERTR